MYKTYVLFQLKLNLAFARSRKIIFLLLFHLVFKTMYRDVPKELFYANFSEDA